MPMIKLRSHEKNKKEFGPVFEPNMFGQQTNRKGRSITVHHCSASQDLLPLNTCAGK